MVPFQVIVAPTQGVLRYVPFAVNASVGDTVQVRAFSNICLVNAFLTLLCISTVRLGRQQPHRDQELSARGLQQDEQRTLRFRHSEPVLRLLVLVSSMH